MGLVVIRQAVDHAIDDVPLPPREFDEVAASNREDLRGIVDVQRDVAAIPDRSNRVLEFSPHRRTVARIFRSGLAETTWE